MQAGRLRHRVALQQAMTTQNIMGEPTDGWVTYKTVSASVGPLRGAERERIQSVDADIKHKVVIRYLKQLSAKHRVLHRGRSLDINEIINPDERNIELTLYCSEAVD